MEGLFLTRGTEHYRWEGRLGYEDMALMLCVSLLSYSLQKPPWTTKCTEGRAPGSMAG